MGKRRRTASGMKLLDIVIPVHGRFDLLGMCIDAIPDAAVDISYKIILVDNASPNQGEASKFYDGLSSDVVVIRCHNNTGYPRGCNIGVRKGNSPLVLVLNSDVILRPNAIRNAVISMDDPSIGVVGMKLLFPSKEDAERAGLAHNIRPPGMVQHVGLETDASGNFYHIFLAWSPDNPRVMAVREVYAVTGAALMTRRSIWNAVGGFYEGYGIGTWEDIDFCLSARRLGYNVIVEQNSVGVHYTGASLVGGKLMYPIGANRLIFLQRWANNLEYTEWKRL